MNDELKYKAVAYMSFTDFKIEKSNGYVKLSSFRILTTYRETEDEFFSGTPECWDQVIYEVMGSLRLIPYYIYHEFVPLNQCNTVTDYKKIWGLKNIERGECDISYTVSRGKMYLGIKKGTPNICVPANIILYLPSSEIDKADTAINLMKETSYDFAEVSYSCVLQRITEMIPGAYLFHYYVKDSMCCLVVYGRKSDTLFEGKFCENYDEKAVPIYRIGL